MYNIFNKSKKQKKKAFTIIELLVTIAIIGLLASLVFVYTQDARAIARDRTRDAEAGEKSSSLRKALEVYYSAYGEYPSSVDTEDTDGCCIEGNDYFENAMSSYLSDIPEDPNYNPDDDDDLDRFCYRYKTENDGEEYKIHVEYERGGWKETYSWGGGGISWSQPTADFNAVPTNGPAPLTVNFFDTSNSEEGEIVAWKWDFNNDDIIDSTIKDPTYVYNESGQYTVKLEAYETDGDSDIEIKTDYITVEGGPDMTPPGLVSDFTAEAGDEMVTLRWTNPIDADFQGTMICYRIDGVHPINHTDGILVIDKIAPPGSDDSFVHILLENGITYYYSAFTYDMLGNFSEGVNIIATPIGPPPPGP